VVRNYCAQVSQARTIGLPLPATISISQASSWNAEAFKSGP
jgi:hypothetical protein